MGGSSLTSPTRELIHHSGPGEATSPQSLASSRPARLAGNLSNGDQNVQPAGADVGVLPCDVGKGRPPSLLDQADRACGIFVTGQGRGGDADSV
jgi:hypothetical protein